MCSGTPVMECPKRCAGFSEGTPMIKNNRIALYISVAYCGLATLWIFIAERLLPLFGTTPAEIATLAMYKGLFFVAATSLFLYLAINSFVRRKCNRCRTVLETIDDAVFIYELESGTILDVNRKALELFGGNCGSVLSELPGMELGLGRARWKEPLEWFGKAAEGGTDTFEWETRRADGRIIWFDVKLQKINLNGIPRMIAVARDISERIRSENAQKRRNRTLRMLLTCNEVLTHAHSDRELFENICKIIVEDGFYRFAWVGLAVNDQEKKVKPAAHAGLI
ncbi:MAG: PAS domain S-box protein, partial [Candidatus Zixiibacteriota bacterium]